MDLAELKRRAREARAFRFAVGGFEFAGVLPSELDMRVTYATAANSEAAFQAVALASLTGWAGVKAWHLVPELALPPAEPVPVLAPDAAASAPVAGPATEPDLPFDAEAAALFFASRAGLFYDLAGRIMAAVHQRHDKLASAEKNSASTSA